MYLGVNGVVSKISMVLDSFSLVMEVAAVLAAISMARAT